MSDKTLTFRFSKRQKAHIVDPVNSDLTLCGMKCTSLQGPELDYFPAGFQLCEHCIAPIRHLPDGQENNASESVKLGSCDSEVDNLKRIVSALEPHPAQTRQRMLDYINDRYTDQVTESVCKAASLVADMLEGKAEWLPKNPHKGIDELLEDGWDGCSEAILTAIKKEMER